MPTRASSSSAIARAGRRSTARCSRRPTSDRLLLDRGADIHALHGAGPGDDAGYAAVDFQPIDLALFWHGRGDVDTARLLLARGAATI